MSILSFEKTDERNNKDEKIYIHVLSRKKKNKLLNRSERKLTYKKISFP